MDRVLVGERTQRIGAYENDGHDQQARAGADKGPKQAASMLWKRMPALAIRESRSTRETSPRLRAQPFDHLTADDHRLGQADGFVV
jgi:hypothetical protein